ncbi:MAG: hypothetical protein IJU19_01350 [Bacteroidales bacterium]|nr:hypothetical protein [Bacteroidales bacterium]
MACGLLFFASCEKDNNSTNQNAQAETSLAGTQWTGSYDYSNKTYTFSFLTATTVRMTVSDAKYSLDGTYTYANGAGTMKFNDDGDIENFTFTVSGNNMVIVDEDGDSLQLTKVGSSNDGGQGGGTTISMAGTSWYFAYDDDDLEWTSVIVFESSSRFYMLWYHYGTPDGDPEYGTYTYNNGRGTMTITDGDVVYNYRFTVSGSYMDVERIGGESTFRYKKQNDGDQGGGTTVLTSLVGTQWRIDDTYPYEYTMITFETSRTVDFSYYFYEGGYEGSKSGTYTYSNGSGSINLDDEPITFTISGNRMYLDDGDAEYVAIRSSK